MKVIYSILYKNAIEDVIEVPITEENKTSIEDLYDVIKYSFNNNAPGYVSVSDGNEINIVNLSEVARVNYQISEEDLT
ncbi:hypothetical protein [Oceanobacillus oncorhynchi]|uniref:hypothetical protein n=1 Tax=Oceanobacillus oncorhynchi TaxID=545501 RepID=UPI0018694DD2|nr:hypothetical protein [Oceanobacillus oncorhynchi]